MKIFTFGSGAWGLALSNVLAENGNQVFVFSRSLDTAYELNNFHTSKKYLPEIILNENIKGTNELNEINSCDYLLIAVPSKAIKDIVDKLNFTLSKKIKIINATKGLEPTSNKRIQAYILDNLNNNYIENLASILGPGFAIEVCKHNLTCLNSVSENLDYAKTIQRLFSNNYFRVYASTDVRGAEYGSSIKNAIAIASGLMKGLGFNENTKAALITRGLTEMTRFGVKNGAKKETFFGLTGVGDLILTCNSTESRNFSFGYNVGITKDAKKVREENHITVEGLNTIKVIHKLSCEMDIDVPIINALYDILFEYKDIISTVQNLMLRPLKTEVIE